MPIIAMVLLCLLVPSTVKAAPIPEALAVKAIIGEAANQGYQGMFAVAHAIRNRGTLSGVYGLNAKRKEPQWVHEMALKAWRASAVRATDPTHGATLWENIKAFGRPNWNFSKLTKTYEYKDHSFYKEGKNE